VTFLFYFILLLCENLGRHSSRVDKLPTVNSMVLVWILSLDFDYHFQGVVPPIDQGWRGPLFTPWLYSAFALPFFSAASSVMSTL
jgi:hypothetical protein